MYAVVKTGGKQYRVQKEDVVLVEKLNANDGDQLVLGDVLMVGDGKKVTLGTPLVNDAAVMAQVIRQTRGKKLQWYINEEERIVEENKVINKI